MVETKPINIVAQVGKNIAARRKQLNLRQDQVAEAIGIEPESVSRFERAAHAPSLKTLEKLAAVLGVRPDELLKTEAPEPPNEMTTIMCHLAPLSPENREFVIKGMRELAIHLASQQSKEERAEESAK